MKASAVKTTRAVGRRLVGRQPAIVSLLAFFIVGWIIIIPLNIARGQREARDGLAPAGH